MTYYLKARSRALFVQVSMKMYIVRKVGGKEQLLLRGSCHAAARSSLMQTTVQESSSKDSLRTRRILSCARKLKFERIQ